MTNDRHIKSNITKELTAKGDNLRKVMNDEELKDYLDGQPNAICEFETFLNEINKKDNQNTKLLEDNIAIFMKGIMSMKDMSGDNKIKVLKDNTIVIESEKERVEMSGEEIFNEFFED